MLALVKFKPDLMNQQFLSTILILLVLSLACEPESSTGKVIKISDGDSFTLLNSDNEEIRIRLQGIDAPEYKQPYSRKSREALSDLIFQKQIEVDVVEYDRYGRNGSTNIPGQPLYQCRNGSAGSCLGISKIRHRPWSL